MGHNNNDNNSNHNNNIKYHLLITNSFIVYNTFYFMISEFLQINSIHDIHTYSFYNQNNTTHILFIHLQN